MRTVYALPRRAFAGPSVMTTQAGTAAQEWARAAVDEEHGAFCASWRQCSHPIAQHHLPTQVPKPVAEPSTGELRCHRHCLTTASLHREFNPPVGTF